MSELSGLLFEQSATAAGLLAYLTGLVTIRPRPSLYHHDDHLSKHTLNDSFVAVDKTVIVMIDALRSDQLVTATTPLMPYLQGQLSNGDARGYILHTAAPTVTLPRIKSMVTGSVPGFMDIVENFGAGELVDDNIIMRWKAKGERIHFYGDDTWLKLFPSQFSKHEGVTSFFVSDYTEVDYNVTRQLNKVLPSDEWDILILHYLGLDHIGHLEGPMSPLIGPKLLEMDALVKKIHVTLEAKGFKYLLLVCGDHGMHEAGGHGGSSLSETTTSAVFLSNIFKGKRKGKVQETRQIDLASTLGLLTGVGVPQGNVGRPITDLLEAITPKRRMALHRQAARQLLGITQDSDIHLNHGNAELLFEKTTQLHEKILQDLQQNSGDNEAEFERISKFYINCQQEISDALSARQQSYDLPIIYIATTVIIMIFLVCICREIKGFTLSSRRHIQRTTVGLCFGFTFLSWFLVCTISSGSKMCRLYEPTSWFVLLAFTYVIIMVTSFYSPVITKHKHKSSNRTSLKDMTQCFLLFGTFLHTLSLLGTSLVEEEHQTLYFFTTTLHLCLILRIFMKNLQSSSICQDHTSSSFNTTKKKEDDSYMHHLPTEVRQEKIVPSLQDAAYLPQSKVVLLLVTLSLIICRLLRAWNSTGDKWRHLEDLSDILYALGGRVLPAVMVGGLILSFLIFLHTSWPLVLITCIAIFGRHYPFYYDGTLEAMIAYLIILCLYICGIFKTRVFDVRAHSKFYKMMDDYDVSDRMSILLQYSYTAFGLLCLLLQRVHNVGMLSLVLVQNWIITRVLYKLVSSRYLSSEGAALAVNWLAFTHFFNQGNSNSLTTVDLSAGFVGVRSYHPLLHGILIATQTFGGPFLTYLAWLVHLVSRDEPEERWQRSLYVWWCVRLATVTLYLFNVTCQRYHLFIWSVFTPKLLYEGAHVLVLCAITLYVWGVNKLCTFPKVTYRFE